MRRLESTSWVIVCLSLGGAACGGEVAESPPAVLPIAGAATLVVVTQETETGLVESTEGARVLREGEERPVEAGMPLLPGDELVISPGSRAIVRFGAVHEVVVGADTRVAVQESSVFLTIGRVLVRTISEARSVFKVETRYVTAGIEGTEFQVIVLGPEEVDIAVLEGAVRVESNRETWEARVLEAGQRAALRTGSTPPSPVGLAEPEQSAIREWVVEIDRAAGIQPRMSPMEQEDAVIAIDSLAIFLDGVTEDINASTSGVDREDYGRAESAQVDAKAKLTSTEEAFANLALRRGDERYHTIYGLASRNREVQRTIVDLQDSVIAQARREDWSRFDTTLELKNTAIDDYNSRVDSLNAILQEP